MTTVAGVELNRLGFCDSFVKGKEKRTNQQPSNWTNGPLNGGRRGTMPGTEHPPTQLPGNSGSGSLEKNLLQLFC